MELLKWELRKIWRPGILAAILLLEIRNLVKVSRSDDEDEE